MPGHPVFTAAFARGGGTVVGLQLWVTVWISQAAASCHLGYIGLFTPFLLSLFNMQDDTFSRRGPEMLFPCIL